MTKNDENIINLLSLTFPTSPSLFQHVMTPKKQVPEDQEFHWDIDEVSCINPANFQPHETQFKERIDPESEARAQAAITTFFSEHQIGSFSRNSIVTI
jgi:protein aurora borealis